MTTRLRKTFHYPSEDEDSSSDRNPDDELDENQQEAIIADIRRKDEASLDLWRKVFTALPLLVAIAFPISLVRGATRRDALIALLAVTSLGSTAYAMYFLPVVKDSEPMGGVAGQRQRAVKASLDTPVARYLPLANGVLSAVLAIFGILFWTRGDVVGAIWALVPGIIYAIVMVARHDLIPMDVETLERLRYEYKGV